MDTFWSFLEKTTDEAVDERITVQSTSRRDDILEISRSDTITTSSSTSTSTDITTNTTTDVVNDITVTETKDTFFGSIFVGNPLKLTLRQDSPSEDQISGNILNNYLLPQYHINLVMLSQEDALAVQKGSLNPQINLDDLRLEKNKQRQVVMASTGEVFRNTTLTGLS